MEQQPNRGRGRGTRGAPGAAGGQPNWKQGGGDGGGGRPGPSQPRQPHSAAPQQPSTSRGAGVAAAADANPQAATTVRTVPRGGGGGGNGGSGGGDTGALGRGAMRGSRYVPEVVITRRANAPSKQGASGTKLVVKTNYFRLTRKNKDSIFQYRVDFEPTVEDTRVMQALIRTQGPVIGPYIFDGTLLFLYNKLRLEEVDLQVKDPRTDALYKVKIRHVGTVDMTSEKAFMILNLMHRQAMGSLKLLLINRHFFDPEAKITIPQYGLELYPGYVTSIRQHEQDILLCVDVTHRVLRTDTCYKMLQTVQRQPGSFRDNFRKQVLGAQVMSVYNQKMYKICDVDFNVSPSSSFSTKDGSSITFMDYYKKQYNITIRDPKQPMLVSMPSERMARIGITSPILLVPELCRLTGITDEMRRDFHQMRAIADHTRIGADKRIQRLERFNERLQSTPASREVFQFWKTELERRLVEVPARTLRQESILFRLDGDAVPSGPEADWGQALHRNQMFKSVPLHRWYVVCERGKESMAKDFLGCVMQAARGMSFKVSEPRLATVQNDSGNAYVNVLTELLNEDLQLVMCIVPNDRADRYSVIKRKCCVDRALPCQVIKLRTITPKNGNVRTLMSVATKVVIQLNCKLGGIPWMVRNPLSTAMVVGFDVCHDTHDRSKSYGAMVATMYASKQTEPKYFSTIEPHTRGEELSNFIANGVGKALRSYQASFGAGTLPRRILVYRDGVGDGQLRGVVDFEVKKIKQRLLEVYANVQDFKPQLSVIVVSKRINTRLFMADRNPPPGTIVDDIITLPERTDFFLISQTVRQGTVSPTSYNVVHDESGLTADQLQVYTSKQTHLYYNWCGTIAVPAVCQYAHKLAFLTAQYLHNQPHQQLENRLYYL
ncbi:protein aubergine-like [Anopheles stephensi]|uniref:protein aubergine-like n=1 Tax=Anopheles stephensi TaxID=30069 RepID=UPI001658B434|nr:protein aubergine-like [Anopheles stephensi]XP_035903683.1 protein aubergine-like [Anopheles stephensi]XP_035903684.1 protein aubergine-like [Anopheles stephensi]XP_035903685.1 protein aubergine-like [Anopheles stephensi]